MVAVSSDSIQFALHTHTSAISLWAMTDVDRRRLASTKMFYYVLWTQQYIANITWRFLQERIFNFHLDF